MSDSLLAALAVVAGLVAGYIIAQALVSVSNWFDGGLKG